MFAFSAFKFDHCHNCHHHIEPVNITVATLWTKLLTYTIKWLLERVRVKKNKPSEHDKERVKEKQSVLL